MARKRIEKVLCSALLALSICRMPVYATVTSAEIMEKEDSNTIDLSKDYDIKEEDSKEGVDEKEIETELSDKESLDAENLDVGNFSSTNQDTKEDVWENIQKEDVVEGDSQVVSSDKNIESNENQKEVFVPAQVAMLNDILVKETDEGQVTLDADYDTDSTNPTFRWLLYDVNAKEWSLFSEWSDKSQSQGSLKAGNYWFHVEMRASNGTIVSKTLAYNILPKESRTMEIKDIYAFEASDGIHAGAVHETNMLSKKFRWLVYDLEKETWGILSDWQETNWVTWKPKRGNYWLRVESFNGQGQLVEKTISYKVEKTYAKEAKISGIYAFEENGQINAGAVYTANTNEVKFRWLSYNQESGQWKLVSDWKKDNWLQWLPNRGNYWLRVEAKIDGEEVSNHTITYVVNKDLEPYFHFTEMAMKKSGDLIFTEAQYRSNQEDLEIQWLLYDLQTQQWSMIADWTKGLKNATVAPQKDGQYWIAVKIRGRHIEEFTKINWLSYSRARTAKEVFAPIIRREGQTIYPTPTQNRAAIAVMGPLCSQDQRESGILASVTMAQFILESGFGGTDLAQSANNLFGMKASLSGRNWQGSTWDGVSVYTKQSPEDDGNGNITYPVSTFRKYASIEDSIKDHSAYLRNAKKGSDLRYAGLVGEKDYRKAITIIKNGGYATDSQYIDKICRIIEKYNLTQYDVK